MWLDHLPASVAFCDVETTGLGHHDRIVSFGGIGMISRDLSKGGPGLAYLYLVFDAGSENNRALGLGGSASLSAVCRCIKLARSGGTHGAMEDAWLSMQIYLWLHGCPHQGRLPDSD